MRKFNRDDFKVGTIVGIPSLASVRFGTVVRVTKTLIIVETDAVTRRFCAQRGFEIMKGGRCGPAGRSYILNETDASAVLNAQKAEKRERQLDRLTRFIRDEYGPDAEVAKILRDAAWDIEVHR